MREEGGGRRQEENARQAHKGEREGGRGGRGARERKKVKEKWNSSTCMSCGSVRRARETEDREKEDARAKAREKESESENERERERDVGREGEGGERPPQEVQGKHVKRMY